MRDDSEQTSATEPLERDAAPAWLAVLVLALLLAVVALGGFIVRGLIVDPRSSSPAQVEIEAREAEVSQNPDDVQARLALGWAYQQGGRYDDALEEYEFVLSEIPTDTAALYNTGVIMLEQSRFKEAEEALWAVLEVNPEHAAAAKALGEYYAGRGHFRSLLKAVEPAASANESSADLQYLMGAAHENLGNADLAESYYRLALRYSPSMDGALAGLERLGVAP